MPRPLVSLVGIFKNEERSIVPVIGSARQAKVDHYTLLDTGSTDKTASMIIDASRHRDIFVDGDVIPFAPLLPGRRIINFAATRNRVLELEAERADKAIFTLMLSGDEEIVEEYPGALREFLESRRDADEGAFCVTMRNEERHSSWPSPRVLRVDGKWRYQFPIHEVPVGPNGETSGPTIPGVYIRYRVADQKRMFDRLSNVDLPLLEYMAAQKPETHADHLARARAIFYLGQTHENLATYYDREDPGSPWLSHIFAAMGYYMRRGDLEGDPVDKGYSLFRYHDLAWRANLLSHDELIPRLQALAELDPRRPEVRYQLALHASQCGNLPQTAFFALQAEQAAREAREQPLPYSTDPRIEWLSMQMQAEVAQKLNKPDLAKRTAERAIAVGGPKEHFVEYLG